VNNEQSLDSCRLLKTFCPKQRKIPLPAVDEHGTGWLTVLGQMPVARAFHHIYRKIMLPVVKGALFVIYTVKFRYLLWMSMGLAGEQSLASSRLPALFVIYRGKFSYLL
jgi:hypothetical protein